MGPYGDLLLQAVSHQSGYSLSAALLSLAIFFQRNRIGKVLEARALSRNAGNHSKAIESFNGKLISALGQAIAPLLQESVDRRFREMPEFMRDKIREIAVEATAEVVREAERRLAADIALVSSQAITQERSIGNLHNMLSDVSRIVIRIDGKVRGADRD